jgi:trk system potassium uptake protein TrkH
VRYKPLFRSLGLLLIGEAILLIPSLLVSLIYRDGDTLSFAYTIVLLLACGLPLAMFIKTRVTSLYVREGFALVGFAWIILSLFGMLPFLFSGAIASPVDAFFETVSGFTTTGSSILPAVEGLPHGILFWRSFTHWVGGMGILVFTIAIMPQLGLRNMELMRAESPGPNPEKLLPRIKQTARMLYIIYFSLSLILFILLLCTGMHPFDSAVNTFGAAGTGGFSVLNVSIGGYNNPGAEIIMGIFMIVFSVNFTIYFLIVMRQWKKASRSSELIAFIVAVSLAVIFITLNIAPRYNGILESLRHAFFQVSSIVSTSGFATTDFHIWPQFSRMVLLMLMFMGACAGSTGGGVKVIRLVIGGKAIHRELESILHPHIVRTIYVDGKPVEDNILRSVLVFLFAYVSIIIVSTLIVSLDGFDFETNFTAVLATIGNIGPGLSLVGPMGNFGGFSDLSKIVLSFNMLMGRLEIIPIMLLFTRSLWH